MSPKYKIVHLKSPKVVSTHETKQEATHALCKKQIAFYKERTNRGRDFNFGIVPVNAIYRKHPCLGWIWL